MPSRPYNRIPVRERGTWIISDSVLLEFRAEASEYRPSNKRPKKFLDLLYASQEYSDCHRLHVRHRKVKRGANAKNWKEDGKYICPSLHKADNIYQKLGKRVWCDNMKTKGTKFADTWINVPAPQCQKITDYSGNQCRRRGDCLCTQHRDPSHIVY